MQNIVEMSQEASQDEETRYKIGPVDIQMEVRAQCGTTYINIDAMIVDIDNNCFYSLA